MAIVRGTILYDANGTVLKDNVREIITVFPDDKNDIYIEDLSFDDISKAIRKYTNTYIFKLKLLYPDESENRDITQIVEEQSINYSQTYQNGQRRSLSFRMYDENYDYLPSPYNNFWYGSKVQLYLGLLVDDIVYYFSCGIFAIKDISFEDQLIQIQCADKFAIIDGTISGVMDSKIKIVAGTPIKEAVQLLLSSDNGTGTSYDMKGVIFPEEYKDNTVPYTIFHDYNKTIGDILIELAEILSCDIYYDAMGYLVFEKPDSLIDISTKPLMWRYLDSEVQFNKTNVKLNFQDVYNKIMVVGSNINGKICKSIKENNNPKSPTSIGNSPVRFLYISDSNINSDDLCSVRAEYELQKQSMLSAPLSFNSIYIPYLEVGTIVSYTNDTIVYKRTNKRVFYDEKIVITSISIGYNSTMVEGKNIKELPFYG